MNAVKRFIARLLELEMLPAAAPSTTAVVTFDTAYQSFADAGIDLKSMSFMGQGKHGTAYDLGDGRVAKFTTDQKEADVSAYLKVLDLVNVWTIHHVYALTPAQTACVYAWAKETSTFGGAPLWVIVGERLVPLSDPLVYKLASRWFSRTLGIVGSEDLTPDILARTQATLDRLERGGAEVLALATQGLGVKADEQDVPPGTAWIPYARWILTALWELKQAGIAFHDFHKGNAMWSGNRLKFIDLGLSPSPVAGDLEPL